MKAIWNPQVLEESDNTVVLENNHYYFPASSLNMSCFVPGSTTTRCPWKGQASYYSIRVAGRENRDAAWYYPSPKDAAAQIRDHVAFWRGVEVTE